MSSPKDQLTNEEAKSSGQASRVGRWDRVKEKVLQPWLAALLVSLAVAVILYLRYPGKFASYSARTPQDFGVYVQAWHRYTQGQSPYVPEEYLAFKYSPGVLALVGLLPTDATDAWFAFSTFCILGLALSFMIGSRYRSWKEVMALVLGIALAWKGILECFDYGQVEVFIFPLLAIATAIYSRFTLLSGAVVGMLPWIKAPLLFMLVPFVVASSRRDPGEGKPPLRRLKLFFSGFLFSSVFWGAALPSLAFGPEKSLRLSQDWFRLLKSQPSSLFSNDVNQSLWASVSRWVDDSPLFTGLPSMAALGVAGVLGGLLMGLLVMRRPSSPSAQDGFAWLSPWLLMGQLVNPLSWRWGSVYLLGVCFAAFRPGRRFIWLRSVMWLGVIAMFLLQQNPFVQGVLGLGHWTELHETGVITVYWILLLLLAI